jgi:hypothetical protein
MHRSFARGCPRTPCLRPRSYHPAWPAVRFQLDQLNKEFNALNKEIANVRKVRPRESR